MHQRPRALLALLLTTTLVGTALPAQTKAITLTDHNIELVARPGDIIERTIQLYDDTLQGATLYPLVLNFAEDPDREGSALILTDEKDLKPDRAWVTFGVDAIDLPTDGSLVTVPYTITIPEDGEPGTHLISLVFRTEPTLPSGENAVAIGTQIASNLFLKVLGATVDSIDATFQAGTFGSKDLALSLTERAATFKPKTFFTKPPVDFLLTVENDGNTHQKPDGNIRITNDLFGGIADTIPVNSTSRIVLPNSTRTFEVESFGAGFMFGKYRAKLTLLYGDPLRDVTKEVTFWIIPIVELLIALLILLLIILSIVIGRRMAKKRRMKREQEHDAKLKAAMRAELEEKLKQESKTQKKSSASTKRKAKRTKATPTRKAKPKRARAKKQSTTKRPRRRPKRPASST